jgi:uncharacterized protein YoxC
MNKLERAVELAKKKVQGLKDERDRLKEETTELSAQLKAKETRIRELVSIWSGGEISEAQREVKVAERNLADDAARKVVWVEEPSFFRSNGSQYIVVKVTPKRIYIRQAGHNTEVFRDRATGCGKHSFDGIIALAATFPEGVENFKP